MITVSLATVRSWIKSGLQVKLTRIKGGYRVWVGGMA